MRSSARRRAAADRAARWIVSAGGLAVIASILGILLFLVAEALPLAGGAQVEVARTLSAPGPAPAALLVDEHRTHLARLDADGVLRLLRSADGRLVAERDLAAEIAAPLLSALAVPEDGLLAAASADGRVLLVPVEFAVGYEAGARVVRPRLGQPELLVLDPAGAPLRVFAARRGEGRATAVAQLAGGGLALVRRERRESFLSGELEESLERSVIPLPLAATHLLLDPEQRDLYAATQDGRLVWWSLAGGRAGEPRSVPAGPAPLSALGMLIGGRSLVAGHADGSLAVWAQVRGAGGALVLARLREFPRHPAAIRWIAASGRDRSFLAQDDAGSLGLYFSTSRRTLWRGAAPLPEATAAAYAPKGDGAWLADSGGLRELVLRNPHPETTLRTLFGKVWYEGYPEPAYVWQSSGGSDEFESKLSLTPLLFGTLKATGYSLLLAIPLAVLGAIYTSHFTRPGVQRVVKPTIEIMASLPSVVLGFLGGLWLAPRLERNFPGLLLLGLGLPAAAVAAGFLWSRRPRWLRGRRRDAAELLWYAAALGLAAVGLLQLGPAFEAALFAGDFPAWLRGATGLDYEQRNAVVVGVAMGFAVIPIIFAISEDALSNVPRDLVAGSRALGADRWQTTLRVVLPTASPGIFSAIMVGFGRAVGETMIVLMATGNTPIMDWSPFNGFRTLSANIAVEIPEAPLGGTLYRTLFVAALLLFALTFAINTAAELVRQRLWRRYARL